MFLAVLGLGLGLVVGWHDDALQPASACRHNNKGYVLELADVQILA